MGEFFSLQTHHKTTVAEDSRTGAVIGIAGSSSQGDAGTLCVYLPTETCSTCFLLSGRKTTLTMMPSLSGLGVIPLGLARSAAKLVSLYDLASGLWVCATPPSEAGGTSGQLVIARERISEYERFTLVPMREIFVSAEVMAVAKRLDHLLALPFDVSITDHLTAADAPLLEACFLLQPSGDQRSFAEAVVNAPDIAHAVAGIFEGDPMSKAGLVELASWVAKRKPNSVTSDVSPRPDAPSRWLVSVHDHVESGESVVIPCVSADSQELPHVDCREPLPLRP